MRLASFLHFAAIGKAAAVFQLYSTSYYSPDLIAATLAFGKESWSNTQAVPITYLSFIRPTIAAELLKPTITSFISRDDVYAESFLSTLVLSSSGTLSDGAQLRLDAAGFTMCWMSIRWPVHICFTHQVLSPGFIGCMLMGLVAELAGAASITGDVKIGSSIRGERRATFPRTTMHRTAEYMLVSEA
jgi:hypothetical protein